MPIYDRTLNTGAWNSLQACFTPIASRVLSVRSSVGRRNAFGCTGVQRMTHGVKPDGAGRVNWCKSTGCAKCEWQGLANSPQPRNANATFDYHSMPKVMFAFVFPGLRAVCSNFQVCNLETQTQAYHKHAKNCVCGTRDAAHYAACVKQPRSAKESDASPRRRLIYYQPHDTDGNAEKSGVGCARLLRKSSMFHMEWRCIWRWLFVCAVQRGNVKKIFGLEMEDGFKVSEHEESDVAS